MQCSTVIVTQGSGSAEIQRLLGSFWRGGFSVVVLHNKIGKDSLAIIASRVGQMQMENRRMRIAVIVYSV